MRLEKIHEDHYLNVGCGYNIYEAPSCDVCCDIRKIWGRENFVQCDARFLPFKNRAFRDVYCYSVLDHIPAYEKALKELIRITSGLVVAKVHHRLSTFTHRYRFSARMLSNLLRNYRYTRRFSHRPLIPFFLAVPDLITITIAVDKRIEHL